MIEAVPFARVHGSRVPLAVVDIGRVRAVAHVELGVVERRLRQLRCGSLRATTPHSSLDVVGRRVVKEPSPLEQLVLEALWRDGELSVREVLEALGTDHAYTTILTVLQRLHDKRIVRRRRVGNAWSYRAAEPRESSLARRLRALLDEAGPERDAVLVAFVDTAEEADPAVLDRLEKMLRRRRLERGDR